MAAVTQTARVLVRAAALGEGVAIASLWQELWEAHEAWGGYPGSRDPSVYAQLAHRLDDDARVRAGHPILGRHVHLVCDVGGVACGQVEGWLEQHGLDTSTPFTCEVRSLVVRERARGLGAGRALLATLSSTAHKLSRGAPCVLAAEVLELNPAKAFYERVGYSPVAWNARVEAEVGASFAAGVHGAFRARPAVPSDALPLAHLDATLAARRRECGDARFDRPRMPDAKLVAAIAAQLRSEGPPSLREPSMLVVTDKAGWVRGAANFTIHALEPPFLPIRRAVLGRFALDTACPAMHLVLPLVELGCKLALASGAARVELTELSPPGTDLHDAALAAGARPWSRVVTRIV